MAPHPHPGPSGQPHDHGPRGHRRGDHPGGALRDHLARAADRHLRRHGGPGPLFGGGFGPGRHGFPGGGFFRGGHRAARGDIRAAVLALLAEQPMHGYQIIQELVERTRGAWRPSPGSVYPTLQQLEDEGLVEAAQSEAGRRVFALTDAGRRQAEASRGDRAPWDEAGAETDVVALRELVVQVAAATWQVASAGTARQVDAARDILRDARRRLYLVLAEDAPDEPAARPS